MSLYLNDPLLVIHPLQLQLLDLARVAGHHHAQVLFVLDDLLDKGLGLLDLVHKVRLLVLEEPKEVLHVHIGSIVHVERDGASVHMGWRTRKNIFTLKLKVS